MRRVGLKIGDEEYRQNSTNSTTVVSPLSGIDPIIEPHSSKKWASRRVTAVEFVEFWR